MMRKIPMSVIILKTKRKKSAMLWMMKISNPIENALVLAVVVTKRKEGRAAP
jgi:hypothetical protein